MNKYIQEMLQTRKPVELTESSPEALEAREILEKESTYLDYDFGGAVFWSSDKKRAIITFN